MIEKIIDEELVDLLEVFKRVYGMGVCLKVVKLVQCCVDVFFVIVVELQEYWNVVK